MHFLIQGLLLTILCEQFTAISFVNPPSPKTCKYTKDGRYYSGKQSVAISGKTCRTWTTNETFSEAAFGNTSISELKNYCRGPLINSTTSMPDGPWCFTTVGAEYCEVPYCSEQQFKSTRQCVIDNGFMSYAGNSTHTDGCLPWTDDIVQAQGFESWQFPGFYSWEEIADHCRNPDNSPYPWCYSRQAFEKNGKLEKLGCQDIPPCSTRCRLTEGSLEYVGKKDRSETRKPCVPAQLTIPAIFQEEAERRRWFEAKFVNDDYYVNLTECRSYPDQLIGGVNKEGPTCFVKDDSAPDGLKEESCAIFFCMPPPGFEDGYFLFETTEMHSLVTQAPPVQTTVSEEVKAAWHVLDNWNDYEKPVPTYCSPLSTTIGVSFWSVTGFFVLCLMMLDCSSIDKCTKRCKKNSQGMSDKMKDLYGSRISLRNNQVSPCTDEIVHDWEERQTPGQ